MDEYVKDVIIQEKISKRYVRKCVYWNNERFWLLYDRYNKYEYHTHVPFEKKNAAIMILKIAEKGIITKDYPDWMIESINRLWFGKNYKNNNRLNNDNRMTNDPDIRIKKRVKKKNKEYVNSSKNYRRK